MGLLLLAPALALAQGTPAADGNGGATPALQGPQAGQKSGEKSGEKSEQKVEQIRHEDAGSRIDELRVGGETRTITVQPKNGNAPAYEITPPSNNVNPSNADHNSQGGSRWKVLSY